MTTSVKIYMDENFKEIGPTEQVCCENCIDRIKKMCPVNSVWVPNQLVKLVAKGNMAVLRFDLYYVYIYCFYVFLLPSLLVRKAILHHVYIGHGNRDTGLLSIT